MMISGISEFAESVLRNGKMLGEGETREMMIGRVSNSLFEVEKGFFSPAKARLLAKKFSALLKERKVVMSTPIITNAGRRIGRPLSACTVLPAASDGNMNEMKALIKKTHTDGMGTGFSLDGLSDPVSFLKELNEIALENASCGEEERPVGNIAIMSVHNPNIEEFISAKAESIKKGEKWKFNISVDVTEEFMDAVSHKRAYALSDGRLVDAGRVFSDIAESVHFCGDPGIVVMQRMEKDNPAPKFGRYVAVAPCAETALMAGETCQFGYINVGRLLSRSKDSLFVDYKELAGAAALMTRALDNALELSLTLYGYEESNRIMNAKRKIGVGICGLADMLARLHMPYDSRIARETARDVVAFINYSSKLESHLLARERGSFGAIALSRYLENPGILKERYGFDTGAVKADEWIRLEEDIRSTALLRNISTIVLPPTGRSALTIDASTGIEPFFKLVDDLGNINPYLCDELKEQGLLSSNIIDEIRNTGRIGQIQEIPLEIRNSFKTALEIAPLEHLLMQSELQRMVDEAISKTINLPEQATVAEVAEIYKTAYELGLKGVTVFRDGSRKDQPKRLAEFK